MGNTCYCAEQKSKEKEQTLELDSDPDEKDLETERGKSLSRPASTMRFSPRIADNPLNESYYHNSEEMFTPTIKI